MSTNAQQNSASQRGSKAVHLTILLAVSVLMLVFRWAMAGRLWNVGYDIFFWDDRGNGHVPLAFAIFSYGLGGLAVLWAAVTALQRSRRPLLMVALLAGGMLNCLGLHSEPSQQDIPQVLRAGNRLVAAIEAYKVDNGRYPDSLSPLVPRYIPRIPDNGLVKHRPFYFYRRGNKADGRGPWFNGAKQFAGKASYILAVPLIPGGTLIYKRDHDYKGLRGKTVPGGWFRSQID